MKSYQVKIVMSFQVKSYQGKIEWLSGTMIQVRIFSFSYRRL